MSTILEWSPQFELGLGTIDEQHHLQVELINALRVCMGQCIGREELGQLLSSLEQHTEAHFREEEQLMAQMRYPGLDEHRANHEAFARRVRDTHRRHREGELIEFSTLRLIQGWLVEHLERADRDFGHFAAEAGRPRGSIARWLRRFG